MTGNSQHNLYDLSSSQHDIRSRDCKTFLYDFDDHIILSVIFGMCFVIGLALVFTGKFETIFVVSIILNPTSWICAYTKYCVMMLTFLRNSPRKLLLF